MLLISTGLKAAFLASFPTQFNGGAIYIYSGTQPASAQAAPTGTLLAVVSKNGLAWTLGSATNGLQFEATNGGFVVPAVATPFVLKGVADGVAGWARLICKDDTLAVSSTLPRVDCAVNSPDGMELILSNTTITTGVERSVDYWLYGIPPF
jgi:hypothetical protein